MTIPGFGEMQPVEALKRAFKDFMEDDMNTHAAALTYRFLLALFPFIIFLLTVLGALNLKEFFDWLLDQARAAMAADVYSQFESIITQKEIEASRSGRESSI